MRSERYRIGNLIIACAMLFDRVHPGRPGFHPPRTAGHAAVDGGGRGPGADLGRRLPHVVDGVQGPRARQPRPDRLCAEHPAARGRRPGVRSAGAPGDRHRRAIPPSSSRPWARLWTSGRASGRPRPRSGGRRQTSSNTSRPRWRLRPAGRSISGGSSSARSSPRMRSFLGSIAAYDNALVSLTAEVARTYVVIRTIEERLRIAQENVDIQKESLRIVQARFEAGSGTGLDVQQATRPAARHRGGCPPVRGFPPASQECPLHPAGHAAREPRAPAGRPFSHPASPAGGGRRDSRRPSAPPAGHPQRRAAGCRPKRPDRCGQGGPLPCFHPEWDLRVPGKRCGPVRSWRHCGLEQPLRLLRPLVRLEYFELWSDHQQRPRAGRPVPGACLQLPKHRATGAAGGGGRPDRFPAVPEEPDPVGGGGGGCQTVGRPGLPSSTNRAPPTTPR